MYIMFLLYLQPGFYLNLTQETLMDYLIKAFHHSLKDIGTIFSVIVLPTFSSNFL